MALALNANWLQAIERSSAEPRFLVQLVFAGGTVDALDGLAPNVTATTDVGIVQVTPLSQRIDPLSRRMQISHLAVTCHDAWLRPLVLANRLKSQKIIVKLGERSLADADFVDFFTGVVVNITPDPDGQTITLGCSDLISNLRIEDVVGFWNNIHPLEAIEDILSKTSIPASEIDTTSLDPSIAANSDIGHFCVGRSQNSLWMHNDSTIHEPTDPYSLIGDLLIMVDGSLLVQEDGQITFKRFDSSAATVADWTDEQIGDFVQAPLDENVVNRASFGFLGYPKEIGEEKAVTISDPLGGQIEVKTKFTKTAYNYQTEDTVSQAEFSHPDTSDPGVYEAVYKMPWLNAGATMSALQQIGATDGIIVTNTSMCGTRGVFPGQPAAAAPPSAQPADAVITAARPLWLAIEDEIVRIDEMDHSAGSRGGLITQFDPSDGSAPTVQFPRVFVVPALKLFRGQKGTAAAAHAFVDYHSFLAFDITIPVFVGEQVLKRYAFGVPMVTITTSLREYAVQLLDFVTLDNRNFISKGIDGVTSGAGKWEVVSKEVDVYSDPPKITWILLFVPTHSITEAIRSWRSYHQNDEIRSSSDDLTGTFFSQGYIISGLVITTPGGLAADLSAGALGTHSGVLRLSADATFDLPASKDIYFYFNFDGSVALLDVANAAAAPDAPIGGTFIGKVITDATVVTSIVQNKTPGLNDVPIKPLIGNRIQENTLGPRSLNTSTAVFGGASLQPNSDFGAFEEEPDTFFGV